MGTHRSLVHQEVRLCTWGSCFEPCLCNLHISSQTNQFVSENLCLRACKMGNKRNTSEIRTNNGTTQNLTPCRNPLLKTDQNTILGGRDGALRVIPAFRRLRQQDSVVEYYFN